MTSRFMFRRWLPPRASDAHKGDFGHVLIVGGSRGMTGAPRLAAWGALRAGAGLVTMAVPDSQAPVVAAGGPLEAMTLGLADRSDAVGPRAAQAVLRWMGPRRISCLVLGPGLSSGPGPRVVVRRLLAGARVPIVLDADGLNAVSLGAWAERRPASLILTPHPGEMARLLGVGVSAVQSDREAAARRAAKRFGAVVVLKGRHTVVSDGRSAYVCHAGNPGMATGGTGDVLAGVVGALVAQVRAEDDSQRLWRAAVLGVSLHARAGDLAAQRRGRVSLLAGDVVDALSDAFRELRG